MLGRDEVLEHEIDDRPGSVMDDEVRRRSTAEQLLSRALRRVASIIGRRLVVVPCSVWAQYASASACDAEPQTVDDDGFDSPFDPASAFALRELTGGQPAE
ncbi:hypothetical protein ACWEOH_03880 [Agromyces sp. NPDC004153]